MISDKTRNQAETARQAIRNSALDARTKDHCIELIEAALAGTNGLDPAAKLQQLTESVFGLSWAVVIHIVESSRPCPPTSWREVIIACRREILVAIAIVAALLVLRPQLATVLQAIGS